MGLGAVCIGWGISTIGSSAMPLPAACNRAALENALLQTVTVGIPRCSSLTPSATLIEAAPSGSNYTSTEPAWPLSVAW